MIKWMANLQTTILNIKMACDQLPIQANINFITRVEFSREVSFKISLYFSFLNFQVNPIFDLFKTLRQRPELVKTGLNVGQIDEMITVRSKYNNDWFNFEFKV